MPFNVEVLNVEKFAIIPEEKQDCALEFRRAIPTFGLFFNLSTVNILTFQHFLEVRLTIQTSGSSILFFFSISTFRHSTFQFFHEGAQDFALQFKRAAPTFFLFFNINISTFNISTFHHATSQHLLAGKQNFAL